MKILCYVPRLYYWSGIENIRERTVMLDVDWAEVLCRLLW